MNTTNSTEVPSEVSVSPAAYLDIDSIGPYKLEAILGEGAMGKVYLATHTQLKRKVAIKTMRHLNETDPNRVGRFQREMEAVGRLDHPNIVRATDAGEDQGIQFIAMEYVEGTDVQNILDHCGPLSPGIACEIIRQAAEGLSNIQEHGLVHRDLKPSNLIVSRAGQVKILDLGIARLRNDDRLGTLTSDGGLMGTPDFIAPEQVLETGCVDIRADIYSLGCTLYSLLSGRLPFEGPDYGTNVAKIIGHTQKDPDDLVKFAPNTPPELVNIVKRMMAKSIDDRIQTPQEVADAVSTWADGSELPSIVAEYVGKTTVVVKKPSNSKKAPSANGEETPKGLSWKWPAAAAATILGALAIGVPSFLKSDKPIEAVSVAHAASVAPATKPLANEETNPAAGSTISVATVQPAIEQVAVATTELNSTAKDLSGSVRNIDANTQQIAETLEQLRNSFATASNGGQIIANPQTIGEIYSNARTYAKQGKYTLARDSYTELMSKDVPFVDVHKNFQRLLVVQEGAARARDFYANLSQSNTAVEFAKTLLLNRAERRDALAKLVTQNQEFGPAIFELTHCVTNDKSGNKTLTEKQWEAKLLQEFLSLHDKGKVLRHYLDQSEAAAAIEEAANRLEQLEARPTTQSDVNLSFRCTRHGMMVLVQIPEKCKSIWYSTNGADYKSTGEAIGIDQATGRPAPKTDFVIRESKKNPKSVFVKYTDIRDTEHGPFEYPLDWVGQKKAASRLMVDKIRDSWVSFLESNGKTRLYFTNLHYYLDCIEEIQYGFNVDEPDQVYQIVESQIHMLPVADDVQSVVIRLKFKDGTQSDIERFDR